MSQPIEEAKGIDTISEPTSELCEKMFNFDFLKLTHDQGKNAKSQIKQIVKESKIFQEMRLHSTSMHQEENHAQDLRRPLEMDPVE